MRDMPPAIDPWPDARRTVRVETPELRPHRLRTFRACRATFMISSGTVHASPVSPHKPHRESRRAIRDNRAIRARRHAAYTSAPRTRGTHPRDPKHRPRQREHLSPTKLAGHRGGLLLTCVLGHCLNTTAKATRHRQPRQHPLQRVRRPSVPGITLSSSPVGLLSSQTPNDDAKPRASSWQHLRLE